MLLMSDALEPTCFIAMPITTRESEAEEFGDEDHWRHVMDALFVKAVRKAGYAPILPEAKGAYLIHDRIVTSLLEADMVLCDLSSLNSNVFFELGVRTAVNKPIALVYDGRSDLSFDTSGINTHEYEVPLQYWSMQAQIDAVAQHIVDSAESCNGQNPLWRQFGLRITAQQPTTEESPYAAKLDLIIQEMQQLPELRRENELLSQQLEIERARGLDALSAVTAERRRRDLLGVRVGPKPRLSDIRESDVSAAAASVATYIVERQLNLDVTPGGTPGRIRVAAPGLVTRELHDQINDIAANYGVGVVWAPNQSPETGIGRSDRPQGTSSRPDSES